MLGPESLKTSCLSLEEIVTELLAAPVLRLNPVLGLWGIVLSSYLCFILFSCLESLRGVLQKDKLIPTLFIIPFFFPPETLSELW